MEKVVLIGFYYIFLTVCSPSKLIFLSKNIKDFKSLTAHLFALYFFQNINVDFWPL